MARKPAKKKVKPNYAMLVERIDAMEALLQRIWATTPNDAFFKNQFPSPPSCTNGSCGMCGKCLPVIGCPVYNCPNHSLRYGT